MAFIVGLVVGAVVGAVVVIMLSKNNKNTISQARAGLVEAANKVEEKVKDATK